jgi:hypothetical protein
LSLNWRLAWAITPAPAPRIGGFAQRHFWPFRCGESAVTSIARHRKRDGIGHASTSHLRGRLTGNLDQRALLADLSNPAERQWSDIWWVHQEPAIEKPLPMTLRGCCEPTICICK